MIDPSSPAAARPGMRTWRRRILLAVLGLALMAAVTVAALLRHYTSADFIAQKWIPALEEELHRDVAFDKISTAWGRGIRIEGLTIQSAVPGAEPLLLAGAVEARFSPVSLLRGRVFIRSVRIENPRISLFRDRNGRFSIGDLLHETPGEKASEEAPEPKREKADPPPREKSKPAARGEEKETHEPRWSIGEISLANGSVEFRDAMFSRAIPTRLSIENLNFDMRDIGEEKPATTSASFRALYQGVGLNDSNRAQTNELAMDFTHQGRLSLSERTYRVEALDLRLFQMDQVIGEGGLDRPFSLTWSENVGSNQINPAELSLHLSNMDLAQWNPRQLTRGADRVTTGALSGDLSLSVAGEGNQVDIAGAVSVSHMGMTRLEPIDLWGAFSLALDLSQQRFSRYEADMRLIKDGRVRGKVRLRGSDPVQGGVFEGGLSIEDLDVTALGANVAGLSRDIMISGGVVSLNEAWQGAASTANWNLRGDATLRDLVFTGESPESQSRPMTIHLENDLRVADGRIAGNGPLNRAARLESYSADQPLDEVAVFLDMGVAPGDGPHKIQVKGRALSLDQYLETRRIARQGQTVARRERKELRDAMEHRLKELRTDILTSPTLQAQNLIAPPRVPSSAGEEPKAESMRPLILEAAFDQAAFLGERWEDVRALGRIEDGRIEIDSATARQGAGNLSLSGSVDLEGSPRPFRGKLEASMMELPRLSEWVPLKGLGAVSGLLDATLEVSGAGGSLEGIRANMQGRLHAVAINGAIENVPALKKAADRLNLPELDPFHFKTLTVDVELDKGRLLVEDGIADSALAALRANGWIDFDGQMNLGVRMTAHPWLLSATGLPLEDYGIALDSEVQSPLPALLELKGPWSGPEATLLPDPLPAPRPGDGASTRTLETQLPPAPDVGMAPE